MSGYGGIRFFRGLEKSRKVWKSLEKSEDKSRFPRFHETSRDFTRLLWIVTIELRNHF